MRDMVLEIGAENLPASYVEPAFRQLAEDAEETFAGLRLPWEEIYATGTPRRLVLLVRGLAGEQESAEEIVTGPPASKAFDEDGRPTRAAEGFARSHGVAVDDLRPVDTPKGEYLGLRRRLETRRTTELLAGLLPGVVAALRFPKVMKWEASGARFARPVRWIVCMYGSTPIRFEFADVTSGNVSYGRPWFRGERVRVRSAESYLADVRSLGVTVDDEARKERIWSLARKAAARLALVPLRDEALLDELTFMLEDPRVMVGEFPEEYMRLPREVITTAMRSHQRYVALEDSRGRLVPRFISFTDGPVDGLAAVRRGNEKVLRARLEDAQFYWQEDLKKGVDGLAEELRRIVFIEGLGTLGEKAERVAALALDVNDQLPPESKQAVELVSRAAAVAKADLASEMIKDGKEFTLLQGVIGSHYARECEEDPSVVEAVGQHYWPRTPADAVPSSTLGAVVGAADRIDTICGCFLAGLVPSGSQDPYGLRRQANGLFRILENEPEIRIDGLIARSVELFERGGLSRRARPDEAVAALGGFFEARCEAFLKDRGVAYDVVDAVSRVSWSRPGVALIRAREIARLRGDARFERLITGVKRVGNILADDRRMYGARWSEIRRRFATSEAEGDSGGFFTGKFVEPAETRLHGAVVEAIPRMVHSDGRHDFVSILDILSGLADPIDAYFDEVLVNCEDPDLRENRHRFLAAVFAVFSRYADFSCIVEEGSV